MTSSNALAISYEEIRKRAQTLADLARWFEANPQAFRGIHNSLPQSKLKVLIGADSTSKMTRFRDTGVLEIKANVSFDIDTQLHPLLEGTASNTPTSAVFDTEYMVELSHLYTFQLPLRDWPCATAFLAHAFIKTGSMVDDRHWMKDVKLKLNEMLTLHFPGHSLEKLYQLHQTGLLPLDKDQAVDMAGFAAILFNTASCTPSLPMDIAP